MLEWSSNIENILQGFDIFFWGGSLSLNKISSYCVVASF